MNPSAKDPRLNELLEVMLAIARQDFSVQARVTDKNDEIDGIAVGLNMIVEELRGEVASRRELEQAHEALKQAQAQLVHQGKLAAIGQLAAGVAHEINNPIQGIQLTLSVLQQAHTDQLAMLDAGELDPAAYRSKLASLNQVIADAHEAIDRVRGVTSTLRTFARADDDVLSTLMLDDIVRVSVRLSESTARQRARLELDLPPVSPIQGNRGRLGQVITNLLVNAIQAIPEGAPEQHVIRITLTDAHNQVLLAIDDTGPGIEPHLRERIFEPFFTTKQEDLGTGLGLALVAEIVRAHGGHITVHNSVLGGARFEVALPVSDKIVSSRPPSRQSKPASRPRVLFIDDEAMLLRLFRSVLSADCDLVLAESGFRALEILRDDQRFDLIVCDLQMPHIDGVKVYEDTLKHTPSLASRFVFSTGGATSQRARSFLDDKRIRVLQKPFDVAALRALLKT
ncbi:MAG: ATP-binding protein [Polyangiaceae bacterium]